MTLGSMNHGHVQPRPALIVTPVILQLPGGGTLVITPNPPQTAAERRSAAHGSQLYFFGGWIDATPHLGGYLGQTADLFGERPVDSFANWVLTQRRIVPAGFAAVSHHPDWSRDMRLYLEARTVMRLSALGLWMLNTHTSAGLASGRLTRAEVLHGQRLAHHIAAGIHYYIFKRHGNAWHTPSSNTREAAVRAVLAADRGVDVFDILKLLRHTSRTSTGRTFDASVRRDLAIREKDTRGTPRVFNAWHRGRRVFWNPALGKRRALTSYDRAHPPRR